VTEDFDLSHYGRSRRRSNCNILEDCTAKHAHMKEVTSASNRKNASSTFSLPVPPGVHALFVMVIVPLYCCYRIYVAPFMPIMDCDEVYNYWEPLHFMLFGSGHQTWEYHTAYALRTYAYLVPLQLMAQYIYQPLISSNFLSLIVSETPLDQKAQLFVLLRQSIAGMTAFVELFWLYALHRYYVGQQPNGTISNATVPIATAVLLLTCTGMNHAAGALLPSATWMALWCLCGACFLRQCHALFILFAITGTLATGWPFGCVCVIPMSIHVLYKECVVKRKVAAFLVTVLAMTVLVQGIVLAVDYHYYGAMTLPTLNIFTYNAGGNGDELYGVEPTSYYIKNLLLNCNVLCLLGCLALPVYFMTHSKGAISSSSGTFEVKLDWNIVSILLSLPAWLLITVPRPHKEERFMFPIYPVLVYGATLTVDTLLTHLLLRVRRRVVVPSEPKAKPQSISNNVVQTNLAWKIVLLLLLWIPVMLLSMSRSLALKYYYTAPINVYSSLATNTSAPASQAPKLVCTCGEWYRYPSSFLLPEMIVKAPVGFLQSSFTGQLPQPFTKYGSKKESQEFLQPFNDRNIEQPERYVSDVTQCGWIVDLGESDECMSHFQSNNTRFTKVVSVPFLDSERTVSTLHRILFVPYMHEGARRSGTVAYNDYSLYIVEHKEIHS
jgi:alpha-1,2-mannosyltransferase